MNLSRHGLLAAFALVVPTTSFADAPASLGPEAVPAGHYVIDPQHTSVVAAVRHANVSNYVLRFDRVDGAFDYDPAHPEATKLTASVDPASLDVNGGWAKQFAEKFLKVSKFPQATFVSTAVQAAGGPQGTVNGDLTLMGVTRPVIFHIVLVGSGREPLPIPFGVRAVGFEATATIKRSDFGSTAYLGMVGDDVTLTIEAEFDRK